MPPAITNPSPYRFVYPAAYPPHPPRNAPSTTSHGFIRSKVKEKQQFNLAPRYSTVTSPGLAAIVHDSESDDDLDIKEEGDREEWRATPDLGPQEELSEYELGDQDGSRERRLPLQNPRTSIIRPDLNRQAYVRRSGGSPELIESATQSTSSQPASLSSHFGAGSSSQGRIHDEEDSDLLPPDNHSPSRRRPRRFPESVPDSSSSADENDSLNGTQTRVQNSIEDQDQSSHRITESGDDQPSRRRPEPKRRRISMSQTATQLKPTSGSNVPLQVKHELAHTPLPPLATRKSSPAPRTRPTMKSTLPPRTPRFLFRGVSSPPGSTPHESKHHSPAEYQPITTPLSLKFRAPPPPSFPSISAVVAAARASTPDQSTESPVAPPPQPLPTIFSPHRRGERFIPGGLADTVRGWVVRTEYGEGHPSSAFSSRAWTEGIVVRAARRGTGMVMVAGGDEGDKLMLLGDGDKALSEGNRVRLKGPVWTVKIEELGRWEIGVEWRVLDR